MDRGLTMNHKAVYENAHAQVREKGEIGGPVSSEEQNDIFQARYRSTMERRSSQPRGHGYIAKPLSGSERIRAELDEKARANSEIQRKNAELNLQVHDLKNQLVEQRVEIQREREQERAAREQQLEEERIARQIELEEAKQSMMDEVRQSMMNEVRQSMRAELVGMMGTQQEHAQ